MNITDISHLLTCRCLHSLGQMIWTKTKDKRQKKKKKLNRDCNSVLPSTHLFPVPSLSTHGSQPPMCHPSLPFDYSNIKCSFDLVLICSFDLYYLAETPTVSFFCVWLQVWSASHYCVHKVLDLTQQTFTSIS